MRTFLLTAMTLMTLVASACSSGESSNVGTAGGVVTAGGVGGDTSSGVGGASGVGGVNLAGGDTPSGSGGASSSGSGSPSLLTCGQLGGSLCESGGNGACGGVGQPSSDCDHCCNPPPCGYAMNPPGTGSYFTHYVGVPKAAVMDNLSGKGENILVTRSVAPCGAEDATFKAWRDKAGRWAYKLAIADEAPTVLAGDPVAWFKDKIDAGWDYVVIDELRSKKDGGYVDSSALGKQLIAMLNALPPPYAGRFMAYFSSGAISEITTNYPTMVKTIAAKGRAIMLERYLYSSSNHSTATIRDTFFNPQCQKTAALGAGVVEKLSLVIGIDNFDPNGKGNYIFLDKPATDLASDATGMLYREFSAMHQGSCTKSLGGVGTYSFGRVKDLPQYTTAQLSKRIREFENWWP